MGRHSKTVDGLRPCSKCKNTLPISEFYIHSKRNRPAACCKQCTSRHNKEHYNPLVKRRSDLKVKYGLADEQYMILFEEQDGCCAICKRKDLKLVVDHDHGSGQVRGLLCGYCNPMIGMAFDRPEILTSAIKYLTKSRDP